MNSNWQTRHKLAAGTSNIHLLPPYTSISKTHHNFMILDGELVERGEAGLHHKHKEVHVNMSLWELHLDSFAYFG